MEYEIPLLLDVLIPWILVICLYIIADAMKNIQRRVGDKSSGAVLYLREKSVIKGIKIIMIVVIIWSIRESLSFADILLNLDIRWIDSVLSILAAIILSYGLYILAVTFKSGFRSSEEKRG